MAPTSIDGNDITGATIDGQDVSEITVDGDVVFTAGPDIPDSGVSRYKFEQDVTDSWGTNDGTNNGGTFTTTAKVNDYALDLTSSDHVDLFTPPSWGEFTVSLWQYLDTVPSSGRFDFFSYQVNTSEAFVCRDDPEFGGIDFYTRPNGNLGGFNNGPGRSNLSTGWNFWTFVYDGTDYIIYIDATEVARTSGGVESNVSGTPQLGNTGGNSQPNYGAIVDDERVYNKGLTSTEVSNLMNTGSING